MRVVYKSFFYKVFAVLRVLLLKVWFGKKLIIKRLSMIGKRCGFYIKNSGSIRCKGRFILNDDSMIFAKGKIDLGDNFGVNSYSRIVAHENITVGDNVTIGQMVSILDHDHKYEMTDQKLQLEGYRTAPITIGNNVWIGDKVTVLKGVNIGNNVVVGAQSLVNKDIPDNCIAGGVPCRVLKKL